MDLVSTSLGFVANAITVIKFVRKTWKDIKDAPEQLQTLLDRAADIEQLLEELRLIQLDGLFQSEEDQDLLERCDQAARRCLDNIDNFEKQVKRISAAGMSEVAKVPWLRKGDKLDQFTKELYELRGLMGIILHIATR